MEFLNEVFNLCIVPLLGLVSIYLVRYIKSLTEAAKEKVNNEKADKYLNILGEIVSACVMATNQTYVDALKEQNAFDKEAQKIAFEKTKDAILKLLTEECKKCLGEIVGDLNEYITAQIEAAVRIY
jgi:methionyl-tRNA synthetase